jgi:putative addiction module component (TIGR02574 family)
MTKRLDVLEAEALKLTADERIKLAQTLWDSFAEAPPDVDERQAVADAKRRDRELDSGAVRPRSHEQVMRAARRALK